MTLATCPPLVTLNNGTVTGGTSVNAVNRTTEGSTATFSCNANCVLTGAISSTCLSNGTWSDPLPSCKGRFWWNYSELWLTEIHYHFSHMQSNSDITWNNINWSRFCHYRGGNNC